MKSNRENKTYIDNTNEWPGSLLHRFIVLLVISNTVVIVLNGFVRIPAAILSKSLISFIRLNMSVMLTSGEEILTFRIFVSMISLLSHTVSVKIVLTVSLDKGL